MHDQSSFGAAEDEDRVDHTIVALLVDDDSPYPWTVADLAREVGDATATEDSLARLCGAGLVHPLGQFGVRHTGCPARLAA